MFVSVAVMVMVIVVVIIIVTVIVGVMIVVFTGITTINNGCFLVIIPLMVCYVLFVMYNMGSSTL